jgi:hypothetical protein
MVILSNGLPKSGSSLICGLTADLLGAAVPRNGLDALRRATAAGEAVGRDLFVRSLDRSTLELLDRIAESEGPVVVKVHHRLTSSLRRGLDGGRLRATMIHRDPRDVVLSARDHCRRSDGAQFGEFTSIQAAIAPCRRYLKMVMPWVKRSDTLVLRYHDLVTDPVKTLDRVREYLALEASEEQLQEIVTGRERGRAPGVLQFNTGKLTRFHEEMAKEEIDLCNRKLGSFIEQLGYELS